MTTDLHDVHPDDDQLLQIMLGWQDETDDAPARRHLAGCDICEQRAMRLHARTEQVLDLISEIDLPPSFPYPTLPSPARRSWWSHKAPPGAGGWLRAAALVALLLGGALIGVPPLRAWVADWVQARWADFTGWGATPAPTPVQDEAITDDPAGSTLFFTPVGREFVVEVQHVQRTGRLEVQSTTEERASIEVVPGGGDETPIIRERSLRIANHPESRASYRLLLPATVERVELRIGIEAPVVLTREQLRAGHTATLAAGGS